MELGAFSISLSVADLDLSQAFYEKLGFAVTMDTRDQDYVIMANGTTLIGLFQGMFEGNILTFNPGLNNDMERVEGFTDVREIEASLTGAGVDLNETPEPGSEGPAHVTLTDPDGNAILIDQFF
jgi:catechol 2,3-dioxygenase-like lactoylglutathione lyase family enzyme